MYFHDSLYLKAPADAAIIKPNATKNTTKRIQQINFF
jgi:hypothetical protein